jgi:hypothetical protein
VSPRPTDQRGARKTAKHEGIRGQLHLLGVIDNQPVRRPLTLVGLLDRFDTASDLDTLLARLDAAERLAD